MVALGGTPVELIVATDMCLQFLQITIEPVFVFRVCEKVALRIKEASRDSPRISISDHRGPPASTRFGRPFTTYVTGVPSHLNVNRQIGVNVNVRRLAK